MSTYNIDICFNDVVFQGTITCDAHWLCETTTLDWSGPYRRIEVVTELNELSNIRIVDMELRTPEYDSYLYDSEDLELRVWEQYLNQSLDNSDLLGHLEDSICENHDIMEEEAE